MRTWPFSYPEPFLRAVNRARRGALAKSISNWHLIGHNEGYCSNTGYILLPCFYGIRLWIWPEPLVAPRVRRALGTRMGRGETRGSPGLGRSRDDKKWQYLTATRQGVARYSLMKYTSLRNK